MTREENIRRVKIKRELFRRDAKVNFLSFVEFTKSDYETNWHHAVLCQYLQKFAEGKIKKLMVFMPPQHGKSELTSRRMPAYLLGKNPKLKIVGCSYTLDLAKGFNKDVKRIIDSEEYNKIFPETTLNKSNVGVANKNDSVRNSTLFETVGHGGFYKSVGVGGSLTGTSVDIGIIDDPVKDKVEAESPTYRARLWDWYINVFLTRLHNDSQQLITLTRWNKDDLAGRILDRMNKDNSWVVLSLPAIKEKPTIKEDKREIGEALWPSKHSLERILEIKEADSMAFSSLYQQDPEIDTKLKCYPEWSTCTEEHYNNIDFDPFYGIDFGWTNPSSLVELKIVGKKLYIRGVIHKSELTNEELGDEMEAKGVGGFKYIGADSNKPDAIRELRTRRHPRKRFNIKAVKKGAGSVYNGIKKLNEYQIVIVETSKDVIEEIKEYKWKEDADGNPLPEPVKKNDHAMDAMRYGLRNYLKMQTGGVAAYG